MRRSELLLKSREAMLAAVQMYNNPHITFKSETFVTLAIISWTYLFHAYYRKNGIDYRYFHMVGKQKRYNKTKYGAYKHWELETCLENRQSPIDLDTKNNLKFLIGIRHEIEHQMTKRIDETISAKLQACSINYNYYIKKLFGEKFGVDKELSIAIQFSPINTEQKEMLTNNIKISSNVNKFITSFENNMKNEELENTKYAYRVIFTKINVNRKGQADKVVEFIPSDSPLAEGLNKEYAVLRETEKTKYLPGQIVDLMHKKGYIYFGIQHHTKLWQDKSMTRKELNKAGYGTYVAKKNWLWYRKWVEEVEEYCNNNEELFKYNTNSGNKERGYLPKEIKDYLNSNGFRIRYENVSSKIFTDWRKLNGIEKVPNNGMENVKKEWMWKKHIIEKFKEYIDKNF